MGKITHCPEEGELRFDDDFDDDFYWPEYDSGDNYLGCNDLDIPIFDDEGCDLGFDDHEDDWYTPTPDDYEDDWYMPIDGN